MQITPTGPAGTSSLVSISGWSERKHIELVRKGQLLNPQMLKGDETTLHIFEVLTALSYIILGISCL